MYRPNCYARMEKRKGIRKGLLAWVIGLSYIYIFAWNLIEVVRVFNPDRFLVLLFMATYSIHFLLKLDR